MAKIKGGYKNVSLKGVDLIGASPEVDGLHDALLNSYDKPIQLCNIVIDGAKKKNAFVQVKKDGNYVIVENLYGYKLTIGLDNAIGVSKAIPDELPDVSEASQGDALVLDAQKNPVWDAVSGGTKLYKHVINYHNEGGTYNRLFMISTSSSPTPNISTLPYIMDNAISFRLDRKAIIDVKSDSLVVAEYNSTSQEYEIKEIVYNASTFLDTVTEL